MKKLIGSILLTLFLFSCSTKNELPVEKGVSLELAEWRKENISIVNYNLEFRIPADANQEIQAYEILTFNLNSTAQDLQLDFKESTDKIKAIIVNDRSHEINHTNEHIVIEKEFLKEGFNLIEINFLAGESSLNRKEDFLYTLFVPDRARTAFPVFDQPNLKAKFELTLEIPQNWKSIANAAVERINLKNGRKEVIYQQSDYISTYLFSFVAGEFKSITEIVDGRPMTMLHRETDEEKVKRNKALIFRLHAASLQWLELYTGIEYPFQKFDFALIPSFQYGGMEHVGAIQYRANSLFLDEDPSQNQLLSRASLIAHETAHMWFGNLVTMDWFNDVWTKEVFANFMASKMVNPSFPEIDHALNFVMRHYPSAYGVDRTEGANAIRQKLPNLNEAGQMYGAIIYNKAPIMMRQLESLVGEGLFREGMQEYLNQYRLNNATWPDLINILDTKSEVDLKAWSEVWVNSPGRPNFALEVSDQSDGKLAILEQSDPSGNKTWPQTFRMKLLNNNEKDRKELMVNSGETDYQVSLSKAWQSFDVLHNSNGFGYGLFPVNYDMITKRWEQLTDLEKGTLLINAYENLIEPSNYGQPDQYTPERYLDLLKWLIQREENQLLLRRILSQTSNIYWNLFDREERIRVAPDLERLLYHEMDLAENSSVKKMFFNTFRDVTITEVNLERLFDVWRGASYAKIPGLQLSENDKINLAAALAIKQPQQSDVVTNKQYYSIENPDNQKRFEFLMPALSDTLEIRDAFFESLKSEKNRETESWVLSALGYLHHPMRAGESEKYIKPSLELLQEIQITGDIFFPKRWLDVTLRNHSSDNAIGMVEDFLDENPNYNEQLKMKILQSVDFAKRANAILNRDKKITPQ